MARRRATSLRVRPPGFTISRSGRTIPLKLPRWPVVVPGPADGPLPTGITPDGRRWLDCADTLECADTPPAARARITAIPARIAPQAVNADLGSAVAARAAARIAAR